MAFLKNVFGKQPLTAKQRTDIKLAKLNQNVWKHGISEAGKTARQIAASVTAANAYDKASARKSLDKMREENNQQLNKALELYNKIISANPSPEGQSGSNQEASTTQVGGGGVGISRY